MASSVSGIIKEDGVAVEDYHVIAVSKSQPATVLGEGITDSNGNYAFALSSEEPVYVISAQDYGEEWTASTPVNLGDKVHSTQSAPGEILDSDHQDLLAFWDFSSATNDTLFDSSGNGYDASVTNGYTISNYNGLSGIEFNGTNQRATFSPISWTLPSSLSMFLYLSSSNDTFVYQDHIITLRIGTSTGILIFDDASGTGNYHRYDIDNEFTSGSWNHLVVNMNLDGSAEIYKNGSIITPKSNITSNTSTNFNFGNFGAYERSPEGLEYSYSHRISQVRRFNRKITTQEISDLSAEKKSALDHVFECTTAGTTGASEPEWDTGGTTNDNDVVWTASPYHQPVAHGPVPAVVNPDPNFNNVVLLLNMNGEDESTTFDDISNSNHTVTPIDTAQLDIEDKKFGTASFISKGSPQDHLTVPWHSDFDFGSGDFTIEAWMKARSLPSTNINLLVSTGQTNSPYYGLRAGILNTGEMKFLYSTDGTTPTIYTGPSSLFTLNTWHHVAYVRSGSNLYLWVDGVDAGSSTISGSIFTNADPLQIGTGYDTDGDPDNRKYWDGWIDSIRITKGIGRYITSFTPPIDEFSSL